MSLDPTQVTMWHDLLEAVACVVALIGIPLTVQKYFAEKQRDRLTKEKEAFTSAAPPRR